jgi:hypothetical protein
LVIIIDLFISQVLHSLIIKVLNLILELLSPSLYVFFVNAEKAYHSVSSSEICHQFSLIHHLKVSSRFLIVLLNRIRMMYYGIFRDEILHSLSDILIRLLQVNFDLIVAGVSVFYFGICICWVNLSHSDFGYLI